MTLIEEVAHDRTKLRIACARRKLERAENVLYEMSMKLLNTDDPITSEEGRAAAEARRQKEEAERTLAELQPGEPDAG